MVRTHGHREGNITHWDLSRSGGVREVIAGVGKLGRANIRRNT